MLTLNNLLMKLTFWNLEVNFRRLFFMAQKNTNENTEDRIRVLGIMSKGFGMAPKLIMQDIRLSIEAKAIYNYFASYAGNGETAFPKVETILYHLNISESRYYRHFKQLTGYGYIAVEQVKINGKFRHNIYTLNQIIDMEKQIEIPTTQNEGTEKPSTQNEGTEIACTEIEGTQNEGTNINNSNTNNFNINNPENNQSINLSNSNMIEGRNDDELQGYFCNMEIDKLNADKEDIEALKEVITYMYYCKELKVGDSVFPASVIKSKISKLNIFTLSYVLDSFHEASKTTEIKNPLMYMCSSIFNSLSNTQFGVQAKVNRDLNNYK